jgi:hypothetical protein
MLTVRGALTEEAPVMYRRFYNLDSAAPGSGFRVAPSIGAFAAREAAALRARAARCRQLAATFYDHRIISELEAYACEMEADAERLEIGGSPGRAYRRSE